MKRVLFITTYASPYRVRFFDEMSRYCQVTVAFADQVAAQKHRDKSWFTAGEGSFRWVQLKKSILSIRGKNLCTDVLPLLKEPFGHIVLCGYSSPTIILAMAYLRSHKIPYFLEVDGGMIRQDTALKLRLKRLLVKGAAGYLSTGDSVAEYLCHYGAKAEKIVWYPFSSLEQGDIWDAPASNEEKEALREELGISEAHVILAVGQFIHRKGLDVLLDAAALLDKNTGIYMVGGEPSPEFIQRRDAQKLTHVHFVGFRDKKVLVQYYRASDVLAMPTREDIWGLVVNEAMACGLPMVSTDRCVAARELVEEGVNGYLVPSEDPNALAEKLKQVLFEDDGSMGRASLVKIQPYTVENMARVHAEIFENWQKG